jgi:carbonic anhydrase/acetyltransferase-like protein (isoleucine patch superfamily)
MALVIPHHGKTPVIPDTVWLAPNATVIGDVELGEHASLWFNVVARGDCNYIRIGDRSNIQDNSTIHVHVGTHPTIIGNDVVAGHNVLLHGCTLRDRILVGMGSVLMDGVTVGEESIVGAGSLLTPGTKVPPRSLVVGRPGRVVRRITDEEVEKMILFGVNSYLESMKTLLTCLLGCLLAVSLASCKASSGGGEGGVVATELASNIDEYNVETVAILGYSNTSGDDEAVQMAEYVTQALFATGKYRFVTMEIFETDVSRRGQSEDYDRLVRTWRSKRTVDEPVVARLLSAVGYDALLAMEFTDWREVPIDPNQEGTSDTVVGLRLDLYAADGTLLWKATEAHTEHSVAYLPGFNTRATVSGQSRTTSAGAIPEPPPIEGVAVKVAQQVVATLPTIQSKDAAKKSAPVDTETEGGGW